MKIKIKINSYNQKQIIIKVKNYDGGFGLKSSAMIQFHQSCWDVGPLLANRVDFIVFIMRLMWMVGTEW